jgi:hypothetical protein
MRHNREAVSIEELAKRKIEECVSFKGELVAGFVNRPKLL